ncbi:MAG TPA: hypothetical protein DEB06_01290, partial [Phycisphaerales bacterium]|nr:hypothetical protein [Phycisphaerales bacterium]
MTHHTRLARVALGVALGAVAPMPSSVSPAFGQTSPAAAPAPAGSTRFVVPNADGAQMRCNPGTAWYPVATLTRRSVLRVVGEAEGWLRVEYPRGAPAVVKSDEVELNQARGTATLTRRSRLRAHNPADPVFEESFKAIFDDFLLPGVTMKYLGELKNRTGAVSGLLVEAPPGATGFVLARDVRDATPAEIEQFSSQPPSTPAPAPAPGTTPAPAPAQVAQQPAPAPSGATDPAAPAPTDPPTLVQTLPPQQTPATEAPVSEAAAQEPPATPGSPGTPGTPGTP